MTLLSQTSTPFLSVMALAAMAACGGPFSQRDARDASGSLPLAATTRSLCLLVDTGSFEVRTHSEGALRYQGVIRRAAGTEADLERLLGQEARVAASADAEDPTRLRLSLPTLPAGFDQQQAMVVCEFVIWLPADVAVDLETTGSGRLGAEERRAPVRLWTRRGDLRLARCQGPAVLHTGSGNTLVDNHRGDLEVDAAMGEIQALVREAGTSLKLVTGLGNVTCHLPPDAGFVADMRTDKGKVASAFGLASRRVQDFGAVMEGSHGNGRTRIVMRSGGGLLALNRKVYL